VTKNIFMLSIDHGTQPHSEATPIASHPQALTLQRRFRFSPIAEMLQAVKIGSTWLRRDFLGGGQCGFE